VTASPATSLHAFHAAYWVIFAVAALGAVSAALAFPRGGRTGQIQAVAPARSHGSGVSEHAEQLTRDAA
jgi:hypothetical protein